MCFSRLIFNNTFKSRFDPWLVAVIHATIYKEKSERFALLLATLCCLHGPSNAMISSHLIAEKIEYKISWPRTSYEVFGRFVSYSNRFLMRWWMYMLDANFLCKNCVFTDCFLPFLLSHSNFMWRTCVRFKSLHANVLNTYV